MAKRPPTIVEDSDEGSISVDLLPKSRKLAGTDADPIDSETGEEIFADLTPRLRAMQVDEDEVEEDLDENETDDDEETTEEEADEPVVVEDDDSEEDEEGASRSRPRNKFEKRLDRERRLREEQAEEIKALRERLEKQESAQKARADDTAFAAEKAALDGKILKIREELEAAVEGGETKDQLRLSEELSDLKHELRTKEADHKRAKESAPPPAEDNTIVVTKVRQWMRKHPRFNRDQEFAALVRATDKSVAAAGFDPETDEFYAELDKRLRKRYPEEYPKAGKRPSPPSANPRTEGAGPSKRTTEEFKSRNGRVTLSARQVANMRKFQLDPTNPADVREYVNQNRKG
jgi:hypothetical protein